MKNGRSLMELAQELERQRNAKRDYLLTLVTWRWDSSKPGRIK